MMSCSIKPEDKKRQAHIVGNDLIKHYGKKKFYTVEEVKAANKRQNIDIDFLCWSHAMFNSHADFDNYHHTLGESCDYFAMKSEMLSAVSIADVETSTWLNFDLSWLDFPDLDLSIFDFIDF